MVFFFLAGAIATSSATMFGSRVHFTCPQAKNWPSECVKQTRDPNNAAEEVAMAPEKKIALSVVHCSTSAIINLFLGLFIFDAN